jgi:oxygen-independent coproporphyrinogen-3 oxidase
MMNTVDVALLKKYDRPGPRYTSYPTAPVWTEEFGEKEAREEMARSNASKTPRDLSLYFHIPFCESLCYFCGCSTIITRDKAKAEEYNDFLAREMGVVAPLRDRNRRVVQLHLGGGTPSSLTPAQTRTLFRNINDHFTVDYKDGEISVEIDPREASNHYLETLKTVGVNRISMGVQDFDPAVQTAVHRIQPLELTERVFRKCRELAFHSINIDLIYGLPFQTVESFSRTLDQIIALSPDRIAVFNYAHVPWLKKHMVLIRESTLPPPDVKFALISLIGEKLEKAGYRFIGMDHFAKPDDELFLAQVDKTLYRNFQGYTTKKNADLLGLGVTAISMFDEAYWQNVKALPDYSARTLSGRLGVFRGFRLSKDDRMRREIISRIMCDLEIDRKKVLAPFGESFDAYFSKEIGVLEGFVPDGLIEIHPDRIRITALGRIFLRNIAMVFDAYLKEAPKGPLFSRTL